MSADRDAASRAQQKTALRRLYRALLFRGRRTGRNFGSVRDPKAQFTLALFFFAVAGAMTLFLPARSPFAFAVYLHSLTFLMIGMNLAVSSGSLLFNPEEADILLHRPIDPKSLLGAKVRVIIEVSFCLALALNLSGFVTGVRADGWMFLPAHLVSLGLSVLFCASGVVFLYNLCLRWFGRERLDSVMTTTQVLFAVGVMVGSQVLPQVVLRMKPGTLDHPPAWIGALPPAWFGALDVVLSGQSSGSGMIALAALGIGATLLVSWLGLRVLASTYEQGLAKLSETAPLPEGSKAAARFGARLARFPGMRRWLRDPVERASFEWVLAGLTRARDVKLRVYPVLGQFLIYPLIMIGTISGFQRQSRMEPFQVAFSGIYIGFIPILVLEQIRSSDNWKAAEIFQQAPLARSAAIFHGARKALICFICVPGMLLLCAGLFWPAPAPTGNSCCSFRVRLPCPWPVCFPVSGKPFIPFSRAPQNGSNPMGCILMAGFIASGSVLAGISGWSWNSGLFGWWLLIEVSAVFLIGIWLQPVLEKQHLAPDE